jgi:hypothetical protein
MANSSGIFGSLGALLDSPRRQRRFLIASGAVLVAGIAAFLALVVFRGTGNAFTDTFSNKPASLYHQEKTVPVSKDEIALARRFIKTVVARKDLANAYSFVHPDLRGGLSRAQFAKGDIPVVTYQAENADTAAFVADYSYPTQALLEVDLVAKPNTETRPHLLFFIGLIREGHKKNGRWLVNYWEPHWRPPVPSALR